ncbi:DUF6694 family lipoprotein [Salidesulfovibrio onnuriiensis]|uniref:DUF6694 family lipoprotein n=1 Tax=Salidesulfovibrio onnuriiensis TaxID=2583823 RepID=UPI0011CC656E|nr:DUF6694 family lipoprotein [Salidesulfovibrio onnuriiensis]
MRILLSCILIASLLLAAGCSGGSSIDGSSPEAFATSMKKAAEELSPEQQAQFSASVALITMKIGTKAAMEGKDPMKAIGEELNGMTAEEVIELGDRMAEAKE